MSICKKCDRIRVTCKECKAPYGKCEHYEKIDQKERHADLFIRSLYGKNYDDIDDYCLSKDEKNCMYDKYEHEILYCCYVKANCFDREYIERCSLDNTYISGTLCRTCDVWVCKYHREYLTCECK